MPGQFIPDSKVDSKENEVLARRTAGGIPSSACSTFTYAGFHDIAM